MYMYFAVVVDGGGCIWLFVTPWTVAHQAPLSMGFPGKNTRVGFYALLQGIFPGIKSVSPALAGRFFTTKPPGKPIYIYIYNLSMLPPIPVWLHRIQARSPCSRETPSLPSLGSNTPDWATTSFSTLVPWADTLISLHFQNLVQLSSNPPSPAHADVCLVGLYLWAFVLNYWEGRQECKQVGRKTIWSNYFVIDVSIDPSFIAWFCIVIQSENLLLSVHKFVLFYLFIWKLC